MASGSKLPKELLEKLKAEMFDVSPEGVLVVMDPTIGALDNRKRQVRVQVNAKANQLELSVRGQVEYIFRLDGNVRRACLDAFKEYLKTLEKLANEDHTS